MINTKISNFDRDNFNLKITDMGAGQPALVIGSHQYYPRTFSQHLCTKLRLICADTRGFAPNNASHKVNDFTLETIIQDIESIRNFLNIDKIILIGHSIHAFMALEYAKLFPNHVNHLVLIASSPIVGPEIYTEANRYFEESVCPERKAAFANSMRNFTTQNDQSFINRMLAFGPMLWYDYNFDAQKLWEDVEIDPIGADIIWGSMFANYDIAQTLKFIKCPILVALGRYDYFNPPHLWEKYREYNQNLTFRIFEKSGHTPQFEEPENFDHELLHWLQQK